MIFTTVRKRETGEFRYIKTFGPYGRFGVFAFEIALDPTVEHLEVVAASKDPFGNFPRWFPVLREGILGGAIACSAQFSERLCSIHLVVTSIRDHPTDSTVQSMRTMGSEWPRELLVKGTDVIPPVVDTYRTSAVVSLSEAIRQDQAFDRLPILADALEEAGCTDSLTLQHCRLCTNHGSQCWVVDWVLDPAVLPMVRDRVSPQPGRA